MDWLSFGLGVLVGVCALSGVLLVWYAATEHLEDE